MLTFVPTNRENADNPPKWGIASRGIEEFVSHDVTVPPGGNPLFAVEDATGFATSDPSKFVARQFTLQDQLISNGTGVAYCPNDPAFVVSCSSDVNYTGSQKNYSG